MSSSSRRSSSFLLAPFFSRSSSASGAHGTTNDDDDHQLREEESDWPVAADVTAHLFQSDDDSPNRSDQNTSYADVSHQDLMTTSLAWRLIEQQRTANSNRHHIKKTTNMTGSGSRSEMIKATTSSWEEGRRRRRQGRWWWRGRARRHDNDDDDDDNGSGVEENANLATMAGGESSRRVETYACLEALTAAANRHHVIVQIAEAWRPSDRGDGMIIPVDALVWPENVQRSWKHDRRMRMLTPRDVLLAHNRAQDRDSVHGHGLAGRTIATGGGGTCCYVRRDALRRSFFATHCDETADERRVPRLHGENDEWMRITLPFDTAEMLISRREDDEAESGASPRPTGIFGSSSSRSNSMTSPLGDRCVSRSDALMSIRQALYLGAFPIEAEAAIVNAAIVSGETTSSTSGGRRSTTSPINNNSNNNRAETDAEIAESAAVTASAADSSSSTMPDVAAVVPVWDFGKEGGFSSARVAAVLLFFGGCSDGGDTFAHTDFVRFLERFYHLPALALQAPGTNDDVTTVCAGCGRERLAPRFLHHNDFGASINNNATTSAGRFPPPLRFQRALESLRSGRGDVRDDGNGTSKMQQAPCSCGVLAYDAMNKMWEGNNNNS